MCQVDTIRDIYLQMKASKITIEDLLMFKLKQSEMQNLKLSMITEKSRINNLKTCFELMKKTKNDNKPMKEEPIQKKRSWADESDDEDDTFKQMAAKFTKKHEIAKTKEPEVAKTKEPEVVKTNVKKVDYRKAVTNVEVEEVEEEKEEEVEEVKEVKEEVEEEEEEEEVEEDDEKVGNKIYAETREDQKYYIVHEKMKPCMYNLAGARRGISNGCTNVKCTFLHYKKDRICHHKLEKQFNSKYQKNTYSCVDPNCDKIYFAPCHAGQNCKAISRCTWSHNV